VPKHKPRKGKTKFSSGQMNDGVFEFDTSETFYIGPIRVEKPGGMSKGTLITIQKQGDKVFKVVGNRMIGRKLVIQCDTLHKGDIGYVEYKGKAYGIEAICHPSIHGRGEYLVTSKDKSEWIPSADCMSATDPFLR
jgi:hypothetical protein